MIEDREEQVGRFVGHLIEILDDMKEGDTLEIELIEGTYVVSRKSIVSVLPSEGVEDDARKE